MARLRTTCERVDHILLLGRVSRRRRGWQRKCTREETRERGRRMRYEERAGVSFDGTGDRVELTNEGPE